MSWILSVRDRFQAAHFLREYQGKCEKVHGHSFQVEVRVRVTELDSIGIGIDFAEIREALAAILPDHTLLNEVYDFNPTAENLARRFYTELFGWTCREMPMGDSGVYLVCSSAGEDVAGIMQRPSESGPPAWLAYVSVADVDASAALTAKLGGSTVVEPTDIPGIGRFAVCLDTGGACFALFQGPAAA